MDETLARLAELTRWKPKAPSIVGNVSVSSVDLRIVHARGNGTRFSGNVAMGESGVSLTGVFITSTLSRASGLLLLAVLAFIVCGATAGVLREVVNRGVALPQTLYLFAGLVAFLSIASLFALAIIWNSSPDRRDIDLLSNAIRSALSTSPNCPNDA
jgi:hypothetical protein